MDILLFSAKLFKTEFIIDLLTQSPNAPLLTQDNQGSWHSPGMRIQSTVSFCNKITVV